MEFKQPISDALEFPRHFVSQDSHRSNQISCDDPNKSYKKIPIDLTASYIFYYTFQAPTGS
jgi:hypothetical protein